MLMHVKTCVIPILQIKAGTQSKNSYNRISERSLFLYKELRFSVSVEFEFTTVYYPLKRKYIEEKKNR